MARAGLGGKRVSWECLCPPQASLFRVSLAPFAPRQGQGAFPRPLLFEPCYFVGGEGWKEGRRKPTHSKVTIMTSFLSVEALKTA